MNHLRIDFLSLRLLLAVGQTGSITQAAQQSNLALAAASARLKELEERLGVALLERHARGARLTEAGQLVAMRARSIEQDLSQMGLEIEDLLQGVTGHIRVVANMSSIAAVLPQDLTSFLKDHPRVRIDLSEQTSRDIQSLVADGQADIGILTSAHFREELLANPYYMDEVVAIVPAKGRWLKAKSIAMDDFFSQDLIILQEGGAIAEWLGDLARSRGTVLRVRVRAKGFDALAQLVAAGLGITALPRRVAERFSKLLRLRILALPEVETRRTISVCRPRLGHRVAAAADLFDFLSLRHTRRLGRK